MTDKELAKISHRYYKAYQTVVDLCNGKTRWVMHVPPQDDDPDLMIMGSLADIPELLEEIKRLRQEFELR